MNNGATMERPLVSRRLLLRFPVAGSTCPVRFLPFARTATVWRFLREYIGRGQTHHIYHIGGGGGRGTELDEIGRGAFLRSDSSNLHHANHRSCQSSPPPCSLLLVFKRVLGQHVGRFVCVSLALAVSSVSSSVLAFGNPL